MGAVRIDDLRANDIAKREKKAMRKPVLAFAAGLMLMTAPAGLARAQDSGSGGLALDRIADVQSGSYVAGDSVKFTLIAQDSDFLLRFDNDPEVFVLYPVRASFGGRVLKYDSGSTAMQVSGWGGITLYTDSAPNGLPAVRSGDAPPIAPQQVSVHLMQSAASDEADGLVYTRQISLNFSADWSGLAADANVRTWAFDAMENTVRGLSRLAANKTARAAIASRIATVDIAQGSRPMLALNGKKLTVTFNASRGYEGRASSRAIARALAKLLKVPEKAS